MSMGATKKSGDEFSVRQRISTGNVVFACIKSGGDVIIKTVFHEKDSPQ